jgi:hypothetical protein
MNPYKIKVVKKIYISGTLFSKPEMAARAYTDAQCQAWWLCYKAITQLPPNATIRGRAAVNTTFDVSLLRERQVRMYKRVLPIFKRMLQQE